jgi:hypothetical protein
MAMKFLATALATALLMGAQTPAASIRLNTPAPMGGGFSPLAGAGRPGVPILGYVLGPGPLDLRAIVGTSKGAQLGAKLAVPAGAKRLFVPPREHYLLLEGGAEDSISVWLPTKETAAVPIAGGLASPDVAVFSARGEAVALYANSGRLQVVSGLPGQPVVAQQPSTSQLGEAASFAVSDDGAVLVAALTDGHAIFSVRGASWQQLPAAYGAIAMSFVPDTHSLVVSDGAQHSLTILEMDRSAPSPRLLLSGVQADRLAFTKEGGQLLAASSSLGKLWTVELKTSSPPAVSSTAIDALLPLRDGHTFLLSPPPALSLLNVAVESDGSVGLVPVTH